MLIVRIHGRLLHRRVDVVRLRMVRREHRIVCRLIIQQMRDLVDVHVLLSLLLRQRVVH